MSSTTTASLSSTEALVLGYLGRTLPHVARALLRRDGELVSRMRRRVSLREIDVNLHMNQAVYAQVMELGRTDWVIRSGAMQRWREQGIKPVVAEQHIVYRRELALHAAYTIDTRALTIQGRLLSMQHHLVIGDRVHARNDIKLIFIGPNDEGVLSPEAAERACAGLMAPALAVEDWRVQG